MKAKSKARRRKLNLRRKVGGGVVGGKYGGEQWVPLSLGLIRKVRMCEEYPFRHQKIQPLTAHRCYPDLAQAHPFVRWTAIVCATTAQATW